MTTLHKRGDTRPDGYRFWSYEKRRGTVVERWRSPDSYERLLGTTRMATRAWCRSTRTARSKTHCDCGDLAVKTKDGGEAVCRRCDELESRSSVKTRLTSGFRLSIEPYACHA